MAKTSWINRNERKRATVKKYAALRAELKAKKDYTGLTQLPRDASPTRVVNRCEPRCDTLKRAYLAEGYRPPRLNGNSARIDRPEHFSFERQFVAGGDALRGHVTCDSVDNRL